MEPLTYFRETMTYLKIGELYPHPDNPRKDVGDVSELAASIRTNGVLQNLTVVPGHIMSRTEWVEACKKEGMPAYLAHDNYNREDAKCSTGYTVIIGHRRLAAAKEAGLAELPCIISNMSEQEQFETMMVENMQRSDLTPLEEADGMQMMIDTWGATVGSISLSTGLSESTVRRRLSIGKLDRKKAEEGFRRGATLQDYMALDKIKDPKKKEAVLEHIGTADFNVKLLDAEKEQEWKEYIREIEEELEGADWAEEIKLDYYETNKKYEYIKALGRWNHPKDPLKECRERAAKGKKSFYKKTQYADGQAYSIEIYKEKKQEAKAPEQLDLLRKEAAEQLDDIQEELEYRAQEYRDLREDFVENFNQFDRYREELMVMAFKTMLICSERCGRGSGDYCSFAAIDMEALGEALGIPYDEKAEDLNQEKLQSVLLAKPERALLRIAYDLMESAQDGDNYTKIWEVDVRGYRPAFVHNKKLETLYKMLAELGYEISKEEEAYLQGSCLQFNEAQAVMDKFQEKAMELKHVTQ